MPIDPVTGWTVVKNIADATKKLYEVAKGLKDYETKQKLDEVLDELRDLKQQASDLEDENRELRESLRFKSDDFEFKNPFYFEKKHPDRALCPKCFSKHIIAPVAAPYDNGHGVWRECLSCETTIEEIRSGRHDSAAYGMNGGPDEWVGR